MKTKGAGFVRSGCHNTAAAGFTANHNRLAYQIMIVCLLNGNEEGIQVDMHNGTLRHRFNHPRDR
jgi:hypothetical protein